MIRTLTEADARNRLLAAVAEAGGIRALARKLGCSPMLVSDAMAGKRYISGKLASGLGLRRIVHKTVSYIEEAA